MESHRPPQPRRSQLGQAKADGQHGDARPISTRSPAKKRAKPARDAHWLENVALRYVARWEASEGSVAELLERRIQEEHEREPEMLADPSSLLPLIPAIVERLVERAYVNDRRCAENLFQRERRQGRSRAQLEARFQQKGLSLEILEELLATARDQSSAHLTSEHTDELLSAYRVARKRRLGPFTPSHRRAQRSTTADSCVPETRYAYDDGSEESNASQSPLQKERNRQLGILARQGFSSEIAEEVVDTVSLPDEIARELSS